MPRETNNQQQQQQQQQQRPQPQEELNPWAVEYVDGNNSTDLKPVDGIVISDPTREQDAYENSDSDDEDTDRDLIFQDMQMFFHAIGEPQLIPLFLKNRVTLGLLLDFEEQDLVNCGVELVGDRKKILASVAQMHCEKWLPSSLQDLTAKSLLSSPGIYIALNDINKHLEYIGITFKYLRRCIQREPEILELGKDYVGVSKIVMELDDMAKTSKFLHVQLQALGRQIGKQLENPVLRPANHIDKQYIRRAKIKRRLLPILVTALAIGMVFVCKRGLN